MNLSILAQNKYYFFFILFLLTILITIPRFNKREAAISSLSNKALSNNFDSDEYVNMAKYFRGTIATGDKLDPPYTYRILVPLAASVLPFSPITSINLLSLLAILLSVLLLEKILSILGFNSKYRFGGCLLYIISYPVFCYSVTGNLDTVLLLLLFYSEYLLLKKKYTFLSFVIFLGAFFKGTPLIVIALAVMHMILDTQLQKKKISLYAIAYFFSFSISTFISRMVIPVSSTYVWKPSIDLVFTNLSRVRLNIAAIISFGIPGLLTLATMLKRKEIFSSNTESHFHFLLSGFLLSNVLFLYSIVSTYSGGRFLWTSYPFSILLSLYGAKYFLYKKHRNGVAVNEL